MGGVAVLFYGDDCTPKTLNSRCSLNVQCVREMNAAGHSGKTGIGEYEGAALKYAWIASSVIHIEVSHSVCVNDSDKGRCWIW